MESALPERVHRCEEQQANHIEILNGFAKNAHEQIATLQHRMNQLEQPSPSAPAFGGGAMPRTPGFDGRGAASPTQQFHIGSPISDPFNDRAPPSPAAMPQTSSNVPYFDPWARPASSQQAPNPHSVRTFVTTEWNASDKKVSKALTLFNGSPHSNTVIGMIG